MQYRPISQRLKTQLKNRGHGLLLLFIITNWAQKQLENFDTSGTEAQNKENPANFFFLTIDVRLRSSQELTETLIFTNRPNKLINRKIYTLLYKNCHHLLIYSQINLKVYIITYLQNGNGCNIKKIILMPQIWLSNL